MNALGLDETLFARHGRFREQLWSTQIVDVRRGQLLDVVAGRDTSGACRWLAARSDAWRAGIEWATLDLSNSYRAVFDTMLPDAVQVADPFHVVRLANTGDLRRQVWLAWTAKELVREIYDHTDHQLALEWVDEIAADFADHEMPTEVRRLGRTIRKWRDQICAWHLSRVSNGPTKAINNLVKRVKRVAFGCRRFDHYRIRSLLYAGRPNWTLLDTITPA